MAQYNLIDSQLHVYIERFDNFFQNKLEDYGFYRALLSEYFGEDVMNVFTNPMQYANKTDGIALTNMAGLFNMSLRMFTEILKISPYVQKLVGLKIECDDNGKILKDAQGNDICDILPEYYYQLSDKETQSTSAIYKHYAGNTYNTNLITFSSFARSLRDRHRELINKGKIPVGTPFGKYFQAECGPVSERER